MSELIVQLTRIADAFEEQNRIYAEAKAYDKSCDERRPQMGSQASKDAMKTHRGAIQAAKAQMEVLQAHGEFCKVNVLLAQGRADEAAKLLGIAEQPE